jgi:hypothetical protein
MKLGNRKIVDNVILYGAILILLYSSQIQAFPLDSFPLWGQTWIVGEGENEWIYPSVARFRPNKVALIKFNEYSEDSSAIAAEIQYANLQTCDPMYSTAAAIDEMMKQFTADKYEIRINKTKIYSEYKYDIVDTNEFIDRFRTDSTLLTKYPNMFEKLKSAAKEDNGKILVPFGEINNDYSSLHIEYYPYNDTLWTFHNYVKDNIYDGRTYSRIVIQFGAYETKYPNYNNPIESDSIVVDSIYNPEDYKWKKIKSSIWTQEKPKLTTYKRINRIGNDSIFAQYDTSAALTIMKYDNNSDDEIYAEIYMPKGNIDATNAQDEEKLFIRKVYIDNQGNAKPIIGEGFELVEQHSLDSAISYYNRFGDVRKVFKTDDIGFWRLHITPEVWFFGRNKNGERLNVMDSISRYFWRTAAEDIIQEELSGERRLRLQFRSAVEARKDKAKKLDDNGIKDISDLEKANEWLSPVISEISSTVISVSFLGGDYRESKKIILDSQDKELEVGKNLFFNHTPQRMYRVDDVSRDMSIEMAAIKLNARDSLEEKEAENLYRCSGYWAYWKMIDKKTTGYIFPEFDSLGNSIFPRKRNFDVDDAIFMYDGCPCDTIEGIGMTPMQLRSYVYKPIPTHTLSLAKDAYRAFGKLSNHLYAKEDQDILLRKINSAYKVVNELLKTYLKVYNNDVSKFPVGCNNCSKSWLDDEPIIRLLRGY